MYKKLTCLFCYNLSTERLVHTVLRREPSETFYSKVTDPIGSTLDKNCLPSDFWFRRFKIALVLETTAAEMVKNRPGSENHKWL